MATALSKRWAITTAGILTMASAWGCGKQVEGKADRDTERTTPYKVACPIGMIADEVKQVL